MPDGVGEDGFVGVVGAGEVRLGVGDALDALDGLGERDGGRLGVGVGVVRGFASWVIASPAGSGGS